MKKVFYLLALLLIAGNLVQAQASYNIIVSGQITETGTSNPVSGHTVFVRLDSTVGGGASFGYYGNVQTDASGNYHDTIVVPSIVTCGVVQVYTWDCMGAHHGYSRTFCPTPNQFANLDFQLCISTIFGPGRLTGQLFKNSGSPATSQVDHAEVFLIFHDSVAGTLTAIDTVQADSSGFYGFDSVMPGNYLVKAALLPASAYYWNYLPTYLGNVLTWDSATVVIAPTNTLLDPIYLEAGTNPGGPGFVGGLISAGANKTTAAGDPVAGVQVMILNMDNTPVQYTYSDAFGQFSLSNLAYGNYKVWAEVPGRTTQPAIVTLSAGTPGVSNLELILGSESITTSVVEEVYAGVPQATLYPNPNRGSFHLAVEMEQAGRMQVQIMDIAGREVYREQVELPAGHTAKMLRIDQPEGVYFVQVRTDAGGKTFKMAIQP